MGLVIFVDCILFLFHSLLILDDVNRVILKKTADKGSDYINASWINVSRKGAQGRGGEREREKEKEREGEREGERKRERKREGGRKRIGETERERKCYGECSAYSDRCTLSVILQHAYQYKNQNTNSYIAVLHKMK